MIREGLFRCQLSPEARTSTSEVMEDELENRKGDLSPVYNPDSEGDNFHPWFAPSSPSTKQKIIENTRKDHMTKASDALKYYHTKHPTTGYYTHMNFTAKSVKDGAEKIFFAELCCPYENHFDGWFVTACDIVGPESLGGLRHIWCPNGIRFVGDTKDMKNCYACDDFIKHIDGAMYKAGHRGHAAYECNDIDED
ncbi:hypothetical protein EJB05_49810 [Eragrostis curvula]|uniref:DUF3615 domain-containing protein n=1 Tax=Eragrostis curvula TaxID=38414 RepID=A0A5J9T5S4_9POAL|nr:hypothetical protein EJB05_49810 [Eragrostis curvula]